MPPNASLLTIPSTEPKNTRSKDRRIPRYMYYFTMSYEQWRVFYDRKKGTVSDDWGDQVASQFKSVGIDCTPVFRYHHASECPVRIDVEVEQQLIRKGRPCLFKVVLTGDKNHDPKQPVSRQVTGAARERMAKEVEQMGALAAYERNLRNADERLLKEGNFNEVPSTDVLNTINYQYHKKYRFDEDNFKDIRMFGYYTRYTDDTSKDVIGFVRTCAEWPFTVHFFTVIQLNRFVKYCKAIKYPKLHIDATGSVVKKMNDQKDVFFYCMVFQDESSQIMSLSGALLSEHTAASITSYFTYLRSKLALRSKTVRPAFVVIDFSAALINSVLASFNVENIHSYLRRCYNTLKRVYTIKQLRQMTFLRLCCSHTMKAFSRGLFKIKVSKQSHHHLMSLFAILLNTTELDGAFALYSQIVNIYGSPYFDNSSDVLTSLLCASHLSDLDVEPFLEENNVQDDKPNKQDFLDETDITTDPIIHQSPFNIKACAGIPALRQIIKKEKLDTNPSNPLYSTKVIHLLHKWFAYLPFWSRVMADFFERYAKDKEPVSLVGCESGRGRLSNASIETYFRTGKMSVLQQQTNIQPNDFLMRSHKHILARFKDDQFGVPQYSHGRKKKGDKTDDLNLEDEWRRRAQPKTKDNKRELYFSDKVSESVACKITKQKLPEKVIGFDNKSSPPEHSDSLSSEPTNFDNVQSYSPPEYNHVSSFGYSVLPDDMLKITSENYYDYRAIPPLSSSNDCDKLPTKVVDSFDNIFSTLMAPAAPLANRALSPKRPYSSSGSNSSIPKKETPLC